MSEQRWTDAEGRLRDPQQVMSLSAAAMPWDANLVDCVVTGAFWELLTELELTLLVSREYEHLVVALSAQQGLPGVSVLRVPHPSGIAVDRSAGSVFVACTRNPNQILELAPATGWLARTDRSGPLDVQGPDLVPVATRFLPGCVYMHDLALVGGRLMANAVGMNAVVDVTGHDASVVWWPRSIEVQGIPDLTRNLVQLNSIAAGDSVATSFFTASSDRTDGGWPGSLDWQVDRRGVIHSGSTGEVVVRGLTRPHSARFDAQGRLWVDDSGYGTLSVVDGQQATAVARLAGWTRGLSIVGPYAFVGTSRVIPRFSQYAPGLNVEASGCGVHIVELETGRELGSLVWPSGNQIFAIETIPAALATRFVAGDPHGAAASVDDAWYRYSPPRSQLNNYTLEPH